MAVACAAGWDPQCGGADYDTELCYLTMHEATLWRAAGCAAQKAR